MTIHFHSPCVFTSIGCVAGRVTEAVWSLWRLEEALIAPEIDPSLIAVLTAVLPAM